MRGERSLIVHLRRREMGELRDAGWEMGDAGREIQGRDMRNVR
jgi:hypothetical protein